MKQKHEGIRVFPTIAQFERLEAQRDTLRTQNARLVAALRDMNRVTSNLVDAIEGHHATNLCESEGLRIVASSSLLRLDTARALLADLEVKS